MLASLLREVASIVEQNKTSPLLFKAVESLNAYAEYKTSNNDANGNGNGNGNANTNTGNGFQKNNLNNNNNGSSSNKPAFQRPINKSSNLIANGWLEQQRRSTLRMVWKQVLASLVEARRPGEDTTLWIQREVITTTTATNSNSNSNSNDADNIHPEATATTKTTLDALHQIPMKWLLNVRYLDDYGDFRFCLKVYNVQDEFVFRTPDEDSCKEWVATLISAKEASQNNNTGNSNTGAGAGSGAGSNTNTNTNGTKQSGTNDLFPDICMQTGKEQQQQQQQQQQHQFYPPPSTTTLDVASLFARTMAQQQNSSVQGIQNIQGMRSSPSLLPLQQQQLSVQVPSLYHHGASSAQNNLHQMQLQMPYYAAINGFPNLNLVHNRSNQIQATSTGVPMFTPTTTSQPLATQNDFKNPMKKDDSKSSSNNDRKT